MNWLKVTDNKKNIIFTGESGCGKTELALNCAVELAGFLTAPKHADTNEKRGTFPAMDCKTHVQKKVALLDMDQTKSIFRARDFSRLLEKHRIRLVCGGQFLDTPVVPPGVIHMMETPEFINVMDVGGSETGALTMGQFAEQVKYTDTVVFFIINPFRILSLDEKHILDMITRVKNYGRFESLYFAANPNIGEETDAFTAYEGIKAAAEAAGRLGIKLSFITLADWLRDDENLCLPEGISKDSIIFIKKYLQYP